MPCNVTAPVSFGLEGVADRTRSFDGEAWRLEQEQILFRLGVTGQPKPKTGSPILCRRLQQPTSSDKSRSGVTGQVETLDASTKPVLVTPGTPITTSATGFNPAKGYRPPYTQDRRRYRNRRPQTNLHYCPKRSQHGHDAASPINRMGGMAKKRSSDLPATDRAVALRPNKDVDKSSLEAYRAGQNS